MTHARSLIGFGLMLFVSIGLAAASLGVMRPANCQRLCQEPAQAPCPDGACRFGEQRAGFPLPVLVDDPGGGSPTGGWGRLGPEDPFNPLFFMLNAGFYAALLWTVWVGIRWPANRRRPRALTALVPLGLAALILLIAIPTYWLPQPGAAPETGRAAILGNWQAADVPTGQPVILRFYDTGRLSLSLPGPVERDEGLYQWSGGEAIQVTFKSHRYVTENTPTLCERAPAFLAGLCQTAAATATIPPAQGYPAVSQPYSAYPIPTEPPQVVSSIQAEFKVAIKGDVLTLTPPSGASQRFERIKRP